jgi:glycosyltransferase involved in cell wall biosynthesis
MVTTVENGTALVHLIQREMLGSFQAVDKNNDPMTFVYLGGFYPWHGVDILIRAFTRASSQSKSMRLLLIGAGSGLENARQLVRELGIGDRVIFTGSLLPDEYIPYLMESNIGLSPYCGWMEYSGLKLIDYKAAGLAAIASGVDGKPATLEHGRTGWIVPPCDEDALTRALLYASEHPDMVREMGQAARIDAEGRHSWEHTANELEKVFQQVLQK